MKKSVLASLSKTFTPLKTNRPVIILNQIPSFDSHGKLLISKLSTKYSPESNLINNSEGFLFRSLHKILLAQFIPTFFLAPLYFMNYKAVCNYFIPPKVKDFNDLENDEESNYVEEMWLDKNLKDVYLKKIIYRKVKIENLSIKPMKEIEVSHVLAPIVKNSHVAVFAGRNKFVFPVQTQIIHRDLFEGIISGSKIVVKDLETNSRIWSDGEITF